MKATGEVMAIDRNLEAALQKAVASLELKTSGTHLPELGGAIVQKCCGSCLRLLMTAVSLRSWSC
jgi:carbamoylphosphate synthase large subunit